MPTHVLYIDDSGTKEYADDPAEYVSKRGKSRYFVFGGVLIPPTHAGGLSSTIIRLKIDCFGNEAVEIKSNWLRMPHERRKRYLEPYRISEERLRQFIDDYYDAIVRTDLVFLAAVIDKKHMQEDYPKPWYAPAVAYEILLQRIENELANTGEVSVIIDDMTGATPRGNQYKYNLTRQHSLLMKQGSALRRGFNFTCLHGSLRFVNSAQSQLLQVADIVSYNVHRQFIDHGEEWESRTIKTLPTYDHFDRIVEKFRRDSGGRIQGYGIVKFPLRERVRWGVRE